MKTAISLPDSLGHAADLYAAQMDMSRSELYAKALAEYLNRHKMDDVTERINAAIGKIKMGENNDVVNEIGISAIRNLEW